MKEGEIYANQAGCKRQIVSIVDDIFHWKGVNGTLGSGYCKAKSFERWISNCQQAPMTQAQIIAHLENQCRLKDITRLKQMLRQPIKPTKMLIEAPAVIKARLVRTIANLEAQVW